MVKSAVALLSAICLSALNLLLTVAWHGLVFTSPEVFGMIKDLHSPNQHHFFLLFLKPLQKKLHNYFAPRQLNLL